MAEYYLQEIGLPGAEGQGYYRLRTYDNMEMERVLDFLCVPGNGISRGTAQSVITQLAATIKDLLCMGHSVTIDGLGTFSVGLGVEEGKEVEQLDDEERRNAQSVTVSSVRFKPAAAFLSAINKDMSLERADTNRLHRSPYTKAERHQLLLDYLSRHPSIGISQYQLLTRLGRTKAANELKSFGDDPDSGITYQGRGTHRRYVLETRDAEK